MNTNVQIITELKAFLKQAMTNRKRYCCHESAFSRNRKLSFKIVVLFITNLVKKSLAIELDRFFSFVNENKLPTKGAFSQARYKLKSDCRSSSILSRLESMFTNKMVYAKS